MQDELLKQFKPLDHQISALLNLFRISTNLPVSGPIHPMPKPIWLKPKLICEVSFTEMTSDGVMRHPSFEGMRSDKNPETVVLEKEIPADKST